MIPASNRNRATIAGQLVLIAGLLVFPLSCKPVQRDVQAGPSRSPQTQKSENYGQPTTIGTLKNASINESSGLVAARSLRGAYWTHNDSGDGPFIYAFGNQGISLGVWRVAGATARDWEDIAIGPGPQRGKSYLYIGDIGDNNRSRAEIIVYRVQEPSITAADRKTTKSKPRLTSIAETIRLRYPDGSHDAEALMVHPRSGSIYIVTKVALANPTVYEVAPPFKIGEVITMKSLGEFKVPSLFGGVITGGDISPDGRRIALCDYFQGYELVLLPGSKTFNDIWQQRPNILNLGKRKLGESIAYRLDGQALLATTEGKSAPVIQIVRQ